jgi:hypothetical protein
MRYCITGAKLSGKWVAFVFLIRLIITDHAGNDHRYRNVSDLVFP